MSRYSEHKYLFDRLRCAECAGRGYNQPEGPKSTTRCIPCDGSGYKTSVDFVSLIRKMMDEMMSMTKRDFALYAKASDDATSGQYTGAVPPPEKRRVSP